MPRSIASITRAALLSMVLLAAACAGDDGADATTSGGDGGGTITVLAAASLTGAFTDIAAAFEDAHPGVQVDLSFDGSSRLATAIVDGAPADVFASADEANMSTVVEAGAASGDAVVFATNELQIVVAKGNPLGVGVAGGPRRRGPPGGPLRARRPLRPVCRTGVRRRRPPGARRLARRRT